MEDQNLENLDPSLLAKFKAMLDKQKQEKVEVKVDGEKPRFYKGYDIRWLSKETHHPDFYLVSEFEAIYGKVGE